MGEVVPTIDELTALRAIKPLPWSRQEFEAIPGPILQHFLETGDLSGFMADLEIGNAALRPYSVVTNSIWAMQTVLYTWDYSAEFDDDEIIANNFNHERLHREKAIELGIKHASIRLIRPKDPALYMYVDFTGYDLYEAAKGNSVTALKIMADIYLAPTALRLDYPEETARGNLLLSRYRELAQSNTPLAGQAVV